MRERILAGHRRGRRARNRGDRRRLRPPAPARRRRPARRPCLRAGGRHRCPAGPVAVQERAQWSGGETCAGRFALLAHVLVGVVAERSVWTHGGRHRDVIPSSGTGLERGMYVAGPRNIHLQQPAAPEHGPGGGAGGHGKAGAERCGSLTAGLRGDVTLEIALEPSGRARRSARHVARLLQWQLRRTSRSRLLPEREAQVADRRWMRWSVDGAAIR